MNQNAFLKGATIGLLVGAIIGVLFAPKSGKETRQEMKKFAEDLNSKILKKMGRLKDFSEEKYKEVVDEIAEDYRGLNLSQEQKNAIGEELRNCYASIKKVLVENK